MSSPTTSSAATTPSKAKWTTVRPEGALSSVNDTKITGYLNKQGEKGLVKSWKKRWFVFDKETGELFYYHSETSSQPIGVIDMAHCEVHRNTNPSNKREFTIHYTATGRIYFLIAASEQEVNYWVTSFNEWRVMKGRRPESGNREQSRARPMAYSTLRPRNAEKIPLSSTYLNTSPPNVPRISSSLTAARSTPTSPLFQHKHHTSRIAQQFKPSDIVQAVKERENRVSTEVREREAKEKEEVGEQRIRDELLLELSQRLLADVQDAHGVRNLLSSFHRPLSTTDTQYLSLQIIRQMEYLNLCLQEVSQSASKDEEKLEGGQDEYLEEEITGHFFLLPSGLAYYLFSFLQPKDLSRACQVCRTWKTYAENPSLWAQFVATPSSKYDNQRNWKALYITTHSPTQKIARVASVYGSPPTSFEGSVKEGWLHKKSEDLLKIWKRRWFVIRENCLLYYKTPKDNLPCGVIPLTELTFALLKGTGRKHCFKISNSNAVSKGPQGGGRVECVLSADSEEDCMSWISELRNNMAPMRRKVPSIQKITEARKRESIAPTLSRSISAMSFATTVEKTNPFFGVSLPTLMDAQKQRNIECKIPLYIEQAFTFLSSEKALDEEGLLRVSGSLSEIQSIRADIEQAKEVNFATHDPHAVAGIIKCFFRELPERVVPTDLNNYAATVAAELSTTGTNGANLQQKLDEFKFILTSLPVHNHNLLRALVSLRLSCYIT